MKPSPIRTGAKSIERGSTFAADPTPLERRGRRRRARPISPASTAQRMKVLDLGYCAACGVEASEWVKIDPAHLTPRSKGGCDDALCVVGLCRYPTGQGCHRRYDDGELDLLAILTDRWPAEKDEVAHMLEHLAPVELVEQLANDRIHWRSGRSCPHPQPTTKES